MMIMKKQQGMSFVGLMLILAGISAIAMFGLKVFPFYTERGSVYATLDSLLEVPGLGKKGKNAIIKRIDAQFNVNDVTSVTSRDVKVKKSKNVWQVSVDYEVRAPLFKELSVVGNFKKMVEVPRK